MANSDYTNVATGNFTPIARISTAITRTMTTIGVTDVRDIEGNGPVNGDLVLIGDEFMQITSVGTVSWSVKRGCLDTIPQEHSVGSSAFVVRADALATDKREYLGTETVSVKVLPRTPSGTTPVEYAPPNQITFAQRFARPYPPAQMRANGNHWGLGVLISPVVPLVLSWVGRNRVLQGDSVLGQDDAGVQPEDSSEYIIRIYTKAGTLVRTVSGITQTQWVYTYEDMGDDFNLSAVGGGGIYEAFLTLHSVRNALESWQGYTVNFARYLNEVPNLDTTSSVLLLRFQGTEGSTTVDESGNNIPVTFFNSAAVTRALGIFPNGALVLPSPPPPAQKSYVKIGTGTQVPMQIHDAFASGSWTIEGFASVGVAENSYMTVLALQDTSGGVVGKPEFSIAIGAQNSAPNIVLYLSGSLFLPNTTVRSPQPSRNKRFHWAVVCDDDKMRWFIDGKSIIVRTDGTNVYDWVYMGAPALQIGELLIGASVNGAWSQTSDSAIGALKVSNSAKYIGPYTKINTGGQAYVYSADFAPPQDFAPA